MYCMGWTHRHTVIIVQFEDICLFLKILAQFKISIEFYVVLFLIIRQENYLCTCWTFFQAFKAKNTCIKTCQTLCQHFCLPDKTFSKILNWEINTTQHGKLQPLSIPQQPVWNNIHYRDMGELGSSGKAHPLVLKLQLLQLPEPPAVLITVSTAFFWNLEAVSNKKCFLVAKHLLQNSWHSTDKFYWIQREWNLHRPFYHWRIKLFRLAEMAIKNFNFFWKVLFLLNVLLFKQICRCRWAVRFVKDTLDILQKYCHIQML